MNMEDGQKKHLNDEQSTVLSGTQEAGDMHHASTKSATN